jgi:MFS superfamily sulfate permease-like transporter
VWITAFICTLFLGIELGLAISIALALLIVIMESAFPHSAVLGRVDHSTVYRWGGEGTGYHGAQDMTEGAEGVRT